MHDDEQPKKVMMMMNGPRPSPLMINRDSHLIRKPPLIQKQHHQKEKGPVIIYTQSPKIIHTKPQDFMALVQRLTGRDTKQTTSTSSTTTTTAPHPHGRFLGSSSSSFSDEEDKSRKSIITTNTVIKKEEKMQHGGASTTDDHEITSSALIRSRDDDDDDDDHEMTITCGIKGGGGGANSILNFADMPLFTPTNSYDFFCSPSRRPLYKFSDSSPYGILGSLISPSGLGFIKDLPEY